MATNFDGSSLGLALRLIRHAIGRYVERSELTAESAGVLSAEVARAEALARSFVAAREALTQDADLTASGKAAQLERLIARTNSGLAPLRELARELTEAASDFEAKADAFEQQPDGTWKTVPPYQPTAVDVDDHREIRRELAGRELRDVRALYLAEARQHGHSPITRALEADPAERARPEPLIDGPTLRRAQQLRRERSGVQQHLQRAFTAAHVAGDVVQALERELGVPVPRPQPERVTA